MAIAALCTLSLCARADTVLLKNGNTLNGIVTEESATSIKLDLGVGSMSIRKSKIQSISRADDTANSAIESKWQAKHILHKRYVPRGLEDLAEAFKRLEGDRASAASAARLLASKRMKCDKLAANMLELHKEYLAVSRELQWMEARKDPAKYNATVAKNNALSTELKLKQAELERIQKTLGDSSQIMASYLQKLSEFNAIFKKTRTDKALLSIDESYQTFFDEIDKRFTPYMGEYKSHSISARNEEGSTLVAVIINDSVAATLLLDTGASTVTITQALADKLKIDPKDCSSISVTLANGQTVKAKRVILSSISAGTAKAEGVQTVILPTRPGKDIDGLLGMSFLGRFRMNLNATENELTLEELDIKAE